MGFLDFVEQHDGVGVLADLIHQQSAFLVSHVSRRRAVEQGHGVLLLEFGHVEADEGRLVAEEEGGQGLRQFRLTGSRGTQEEEGAHGLAFLVEARTRLEDRVQHFLHGVVLSDDALLQHIFGAEQAVAFFGLYLAQGDAGLFGHDGIQVAAAQGGPFRPAQFGQLVQGLLQVIDAFGRGGNLAEVRVRVEGGQQDAVHLVEHLIVQPVQLLHQCGVGGFPFLALGFQSIQFPAQFGDDRLGHVVHRLQLCHGAVNEVEGRVGQRLFGQVAFGQADGVAHHVLVHRQVVEFLIGGQGALQDAQGQFGIGLFHHDSFQLRHYFLVSFYILGVAVDGGGAQQGKPSLADFLLQDGRGAVQGALLVEELVYLLDDEDDVSFGLDFFQQLLEAVFHLSFVGGVGGQGGVVQFVGLGILQEVRHVAFGQLDAEAVDECGLSHAGFARYQQVALGLAAQDFADGAYLFLEPHYAVYLSGPYGGHLVDAILGQVASVGAGLSACGTCFIAGCGGLRLRAHLLAYFRRGERQGFQLVEGEPYARGDQRGQYAFGRTVLQAELVAVIQCFGQDGFGFF